MMQPSEFFVSLEQKVQLRRHCTGRMRDFVQAAKEGKFDLDTPGISAAEKAISKAKEEPVLDAAELGLEVPEPEAAPAEVTDGPAVVKKVVKPEGE